MLVKLANIVALGFAAFGVQQTIATPVHDTETHDIARRTRSLKCGWVKSKHGKDLGCLCDSVIGRINADFDVSDVLSLLFSKGSKNYPPGCKPTCDGNGGYDCPNGKDSKGNCLDDHGCEGGSCWDNGKCCPGGTVNRDGICCPPGCSNKGGKCHVDEPPKQEPPKQTCGLNEDHKDGMCKCKDGFSKEHDKAPCMKTCPPDQRRDGEHCVCKNDKQEMYKGACKDKCKPTEKRNDAGHCEPQCPDHTTHNGKECVCNDKSKELVKGHCENKCPAPQQMYEAAHDKCVCTDKSKKLVGKHCEDKCPAPDQKYEAAHDKCVCKDMNKKLVNGHCETVCPSDDQMFEHGKCKCKDDKKELVKDHCEPKCPDDQKRNDAGHCECKKHEYIKDEHNVCRPDCKAPFVLNKHENRCDCPEKTEKKWGTCVPICTHNRVLNKHTLKCECPEGFMPGEGDKCVIICKDGSEPDAEGKKCVCHAPKMKDKHGKCVDVPKCTHPEELNTHTNKCECVKGYEKDWKTGKCVIKCKGDLIPEPHEGKMCVCPTGKVPKEHNANQCVDPAPTCTHPEKLSKNGKKCVCEDGFKRQGNGKCEKDCGRGKKWCKTKCCRDDQEEKDDGQCGCPHDWKDMKIGGITICKPPVLSKIL